MGAYVGRCEGSGPFRARLAPRLPELAAGNSSRSAAPPPPPRPGVATAASFPPFCIPPSAGGDTAPGEPSRAERGRRPRGEAGGPQQAAPCRGRGGRGRGEAGPGVTFLFGIMSPRRAAKVTRRKRRARIRPTALAAAASLVVPAALPAPAARRAAPGAPAAPTASARLAEGAGGAGQPRPLIGRQAASRPPLRRERANQGRPARVRGRARGEAGRAGTVGAGVGALRGAEEGRRFRAPGAGPRPGAGEPRG